MNVTKLLELIESYDTICVFRHVQPDGDALGSQVGFSKWLKLNYPNKNVYMLGEDKHNFKIYPKMDCVETLGTFLAVVIDSANRPRIDDQRFSLADKIVKIDHHPEVDVYGDLQIVDSKRGSACEIVADLLNESGLKFNNDIADTLLSGILTDTQRFTIETTSSKTLRSAAWLMDQGANITLVNQALFTRTRKWFELNRNMQNRIQVVDKFSFIKLSQEDLSALNLQVYEAKNFTGAMAGIEEFTIWGIIVQSENGTYELSLRSRHNTINTIAESYGGGGHRLACGVKDITENQLTDIISILAKTSLQ